jgi:F-type H+-transporting ATPase subunit b
MRSILLTCCVLALFLAPGVLPSAAAKEEPAAHKKDDHKGGQSKGPINLNQWADQAIWTLVVFGALLFILWKFAWAPMRDGLVKRERSIRQAFEDARQAREETDRVRAELAGERARANDEARRIRDEARQAAERIKADLEARGKAEIEAERDRLHRELQTETAQAWAQLKDQTVAVAMLIAAKVIRRQLNPDDQRNLLSEALAEFRASAQGRREDLESVLT